jgi:hypothetical protein
MSIAGSQGKFDFLKEQLLKAPIQNFAPVTDTIRKIK